MTDTTQLSATELNALIIEKSVAEYAPIITENLPEIPSPEARIAEAAAFVSNLVIASQKDENYKVAKTVKQRVTKWRTAVEAKRKELNRPAIDYKKAVDDEAKRLTALITPVEAEITAKIDAIDKAAEEARKAEQLRRHRLVTETGWQFTGSWYICSIQTITPDQLTAATDEQLQEWLAFGKAELDRQEAERIRKEAEAKAAADEAKRVAAENARLAAEAEELRKKLAALEAVKQPAPEPEPTAPEMIGNPPIFEPENEPVYTGPAPGTIPDIRSERKSGNGFSHPAPVDNVAAPRVGSVTAFDYQKGFDDCRAQVIAILSDGVARKKSEYIAMFNQLAPSR